jgi:hypothetical protein
MKKKNNKKKISKGKKELNKEMNEEN